MTNTLRLQLTAWYLLFFALLFVVFSIVLYGMFSRALVQRLDANLTADVKMASQLFEDETAELKGDVSAAAAETVSELRMRSVRIAIIQGDRLLAANSSDNHEGLLALAGQARERGAPQEGRRGTRIFAHALSLSGQNYVVLGVESLDVIADQLGALLRVLYLALPLILLLAGFGGYLLAGRSLEPLRSMAEQSKLITDRNLHRRLEIGTAKEELKLLADAFNELLSRLDQSFDTMRRFVGDASHELRTPLAIIRGEADVALSQQRSAAEYRESLAVIQDETRRLSRLVDDLLNLARADAGHVVLQVEDFYLNDLLMECCRSVQALASAKNIRLDCSCDEDVMFRGDQGLLRRLVLNLLDNAIRYTPENGKVAVKLETGRGDLKIYVSDTGAGISPEAAPRVFERFYRGDEARSRREGGFGLGLSIVKWIAEWHNGTVQLSSQPGLGSTFTVMLHR